MYRGSVGPSVTVQNLTPLGRSGGCRANITLMSVWRYSLPDLELTNLKYKIDEDFLVSSSDIMPNNNKWIIMTAYYLSGCLLATSRWFCRNRQMMSQPNQLTKVTSQNIYFLVVPDTSVNSHKFCTKYLQNNEGFLTESNKISVKIKST